MEQQVDLTHPLAAVEARIDKTNQLLQTLITQLGGTNQQPGGSPFSSVAVDLTVVNNGYRITVPNPITYLQFWCDGQMDGISVNIGTQSAAPINLAQMSMIPVSGTQQDLFINSDIRQGRSKLVVYFVRETNPLQLTNGGQGITLAEAAVRGKSISNFDRRGEIIFQDDFEDCPNLSADANGGAPGASRWAVGWVGGDYVCPSSDCSRSGLISLKMKSNSNPGSYVYVDHLLPFPNLSKYGFECSFVYSGLAGAGTGIFFHLARNEFFLSYNGQVKIDATNLSILSNGAYQVVAPLEPLLAGLQIFHTMKIIVDLKTNMYQQIVLDNNIYNVANIPMDAQGGANFAKLECGITLVSAGGFTYFDDVIVTMNEP